MDVINSFLHWFKCWGVLDEKLFTKFFSNGICDPKQVLAGMQLNTKETMNENSCNYGGAGCQGNDN